MVLTSAAVCTGIWRSASRWMQLELMYVSTTHLLRGGLTEARTCPLGSSEMRFRWQRRGFVILASSRHHCEGDFGALVIAKG